MSTPSQAPNMEGIIRELAVLQKSLQETASSYTRVIMGLGYAGLFSVWSFTKSYLGHREMAWSALLIVISVCLYLTFEILQAFFLSRMSIKFTNACNARPDQLGIALIQFRKDASQMMRPLHAMWIYAFLICVGTGYGSAAILLKAFLRNIFLQS